MNHAAVPAGLVNCGPRFLLQNDYGPSGPATRELDRRCEAKNSRADDNGVGSARDVGGCAQEVKSKRAASLGRRDCPLTSTVRAPSRTPAGDRRGQRPPTVDTIAARTYEPLDEGVDEGPPGQRKAVPELSTGVGPASSNF